MKRPCPCGHCRVCREYERTEYQRDLAACEQMAIARKAEPLACSLQSTLGVGRSLPVMHYKSLGTGAGGEN